MRGGKLMLIKDLFFYIHYCNGKDLHRQGSYPRKINRILQHHELALVTGGKGTVRIDDKPYPMKPGLLIYLYPGLNHSFEPDSEEPLIVFTVHFSYTRVLFNDDRWKVEDAVKRLPCHTIQFLTDYYQIEDLFKKLVETWYGKLPGYEFTARTFLQQLLMAIHQNVRKREKNYSASLKIEKLIEYMQQNINRKITLEELAEQVNLSPTYLSRIFKEGTDYSVIEFFNKLKIERAKEIMMDANPKIKEVARTLGFGDEFYFSRIFKQIEGISPSEYYSRNIHGL